MTQALEGIKILDLSRVPPGDFCTMFLGDMGAEVLKIEPPPDMARRAGSGLSPIGEVRRMEAAYNPLNRNKKSMGLNLRSEEGCHIFYRLTEKADVIVEGFRPGVVKRLGVDYETVMKINPRIIYCSISGYGQDGPYQNLPGHDINYISIGGVLGLISEKERRPVIPLNLVADYAGGALHATMGILTALVARERTGKGQYVDISMTDCVVSLLSGTAQNYFASGIVPKRGEHFSQGASPYYNVYETKDGKLISIGCLEPWFWENLCREAGREDFIPYQEADGEKRDEIFSYLRQFFLTKTRDEWFELLGQKNIPVGKVYTLDEVFSDPQIIHRQMVVEVTNPTIGKVKQVGIGIKLSETPGKVKRLSPLFGENTEEVLLEIGYNREEIERLHEAGIIGLKSQPKR